LLGFSLGTSLDAIVLLSRNVFPLINSEYLDISWSSGPEFFLGASVLARLPLTLTWISLGAPAQSFPLLGAFALAILPLTLTWFLLELRLRVSLEPLLWQDSL